MLGCCRSIALVNFVEISDGASFDFVKSLDLISHVCMLVHVIGEDHTAKIEKIVRCNYLRERYQRSL